MVKYERARLKLTNAKLSKLKSALEEKIRQ